ncbi:MAG TPA: DNA topoisomerase IB [Verrucomicrobiae bacterium]|nr:DNA topoisomerase IB [Verrucomicrobiae bacterium]
MSGDAPSDPAAEALAHAREARLRYVSPGEPGIRRVGTGKDFKYLAPGDKPVTDEAEIQRIRKLAIPPAYTDVWVCVNPRGHLQATGLDARGRRQYRYHPDWRAMRDSAKFERMVEFGEALPKLRRTLRRDTALPGLPQDKVLATVVALLDSTLVRIGNAEYARDNNSFGLTTLRDRHARFISDGRAVLQFRGKGGIEHEVAINDRRLARIVQRCRELPGQHLFQYIGHDGMRHPVDSDQVNDYIARAMGADFTAKDFRTWGATERAIALMSCEPLPENPNDGTMAGCILKTVRAVAAELRNTPAVCRKSYINPAVFEAWKDGRLHKLVREDLSKAPHKAERAALTFLRAQARYAARAAKKAA